MGGMWCVGGEEGCDTRTNGLRRGSKMSAIMEG